MPRRGKERKKPRVSFTGKRQVLPGCPNGVHEVDPMGGECRYCGRRFKVVSKG